MENGPFPLLAEVERFLWLKYLRGVGLLGLRGGDTWRKGGECHIKTLIIQQIIIITRKQMLKTLKSTDTSITPHSL